MMTARLACWLLLPVALGCGARAETAVTARLRAEFKETYPYAPPAPVEQAPLDLGGEPVFKLEPMVVTGSRSFVVDILAEARRAMAAREAEKFSPLKGGKLLSFRRGDLGFWPTIVPLNAIPVKKADTLLAVDLLRIKW